MSYEPDQGIGDVIGEMHAEWRQSRANYDAKCAEAQALREALEAMLHLNRHLPSCKGAYVDGACGHLCEQARRALGYKETWAEAE